MVRNAGLIAAVAWLTLVAMLASAATAGAQTYPPEDPQVDGRTTFLAACAACHGPTGQGGMPATAGFEAQPPNFTDCNFTSREPAADFVAIAHEGGPVRGFSRLMPAFGTALTREEIEAVVAYVKSLCADPGWPDGSLNLPRPLVTEKAFPEDEAVLENTADLEGPAGYVHNLVYEKRFGARSQIEVSVPYRHGRVDGAGPDGTYAGGLGDVGLGLKHVVAHSAARGSILSFIGEAKLPTGDESKGFGAGATTLEAFLLYGQILPSDAFMQFQVGAERLTGEDAETEYFGSAVIGRSIAEDRGFGRTWSPMLEAVVKRSDDGPTEWDLVPQLHVTLNRRQHVMLSIGPRIPVGPGAGSRDTMLLVSLIWDWFDGGLFEGW